jgi:hypothetical protein
MRAVKPRGKAIQPTPFEKYKKTQRLFAGADPSSLMYVRPGGDIHCGNPLWCENTDSTHRHEKRPKWPKAGNSQSTKKFLVMLRKHSAPLGPVIAVFAGHTHSQEAALICDSKFPYGEMASCAIRPEERAAIGAMQYVGDEAAAGGHFVIDIDVLRPG